MLHVPGLYVSPIEGKGRGIFTAESLQDGDVIEICPIIKIPKDQLQLIHTSCLHDYYFVWEEEGYCACVALGYGSLYNHHPDPNARILLNYEDDTIHFISLKEIKAATEIVIDYTGGIKESDPLWFEPVT